MGGCVCVVKDLLLGLRISPIRKTGINLVLGHWLDLKFPSKLRFWVY